MSSLISIDVFTDFVCPWCLVGSVRLGKALEALPQGIDVSIANHPFYLDPDIPPEGVDTGEMLAARYGRDPKTLYAQVEAAAAESGIALDLSRQPRRYPTDKAHTLVRLAAPLGTQHALANAIAEAHFLDLRNIADDGVLAELGEAHGIGRGEAIEAINDPDQIALTGKRARENAASGIRGVPFFVFNQAHALSGAQPESVFLEAIEHTLAQAEANR